MEHEGTSRRWRIRVWLPVVVLVAVGLGLVCRRGSALSSWRQLRNGWNVRLDGVSFGKVHEYPPGSRLYQRLYRHPPRWMLTHFGFKPIQAQCGDSQRESVCFWLRLRCPPGSLDHVVEVLADEAGHESAAFQSGLGMAAPDKTLVYAHAAFVWPSSRRVALRLYEHQTDGSLLPLAEFPVRNPGRARPRLAWTPESLPAMHTNGDLVVIFEGFGHGPLPLRPHWNRRPTARPLPFIRLRALVDEQPSSEWQVRHVTLSDGATNDLPFETFSFPTNGQEIVPLTVTTSEAAEVPCVLWPGAKAWKVRLLLGIRSGVQLAANEVYTLKELPIERHGGVSLATNTTWGRFNVSVVIRPDEGAFTNWMPGANGLLEISLGQHLPDVMLAVVDAHDDQGRPVAVGPAQPESWGYHGEVTDTQWKMPILLTPDTHRLTLSLAVKTNRVVEFVVPAPDFPPAEPFVTAP